MQAYSVPMWFTPCSATFWPSELTSLFPCTCNGDAAPAGTVAGVGVGPGVPVGAGVVVGAGVGVGLGAGAANDAAERSARSAVEQPTANIPSLARHGRPPPVGR